MAAMSLAACGSTTTRDSAADAGPEAAAAVPRVTPDGHAVCGNVTMRAAAAPECDRR
ncbi:MAG TPA: hypothetical protein VGL81_12340 [Polyangiaceae bacterium]